MEKAKIISITLTPKQQTQAKKDSIEVFGKENLSGYIQYLIQKESKIIKAKS